MNKKHHLFLNVLLLLLAGQQLWAQDRRPIDNEHPLWMIHVDVWNSADPQKIIDLIPEDIRPYVCMNLSLSCQYDTEKNLYKMPRCAVRTYKSWGTVCQQNGLWFTCQPASGGHTHIQDDDLETFEYFFKHFPNFLGWNYAEQFWGFDEAGDKSSSTQASRIALFAKLVPMHHEYGGFLTVSFCGNIWSHGLNPLGMMKRNKDLLQACMDYPEAILWLYKYTTSSCWYNNESVTWGPFVSGLAKNYGVRYDNCGWNGALDAILGEGHGLKYPGAAGIGTVMEQTAMNGGAVWDGPELIWTEDFQNLSNSTVDGYTRRNWGTFPNFRGVWIDMFRQVINGTMRIPSREEVLEKTKIVVINDKTSGSDEDKYAAWGSLYDGLYKQSDPFNCNNGQWMDNYCYFKRTGRYGTIPIVMGLYDDAAEAIPLQVKKSAYTSRWSTTAKKQADFNEQYPEVSTGNLFVERWNNQLVTYTPYSYLNSKTTASATIPLQYNTCEALQLVYNKLSAGLISEYEDHIDFYLNNYRSDTTTVRVDSIIIIGVASEPSHTLTKHKVGSTSYNATVMASFEDGTYKIAVKHYGPCSLTVNCQGTATVEEPAAEPTEEPAAEATEESASPSRLAPASVRHAAAAPQPLSLPQQPEDYFGPVIIEAEDMDYKSVKSVNLSNSGSYFPDVLDYAGNGYVDMGTSTTAALRHQLNVTHPGEYTIAVRYCKATKSGIITAAVNDTKQSVACERSAQNDWRKATFTATLNEGKNDLVLTNTGGLGMYIDQVIYTPAGIEAEKFLVTIREADHGALVANVTEAAEGETVTLTVQPEQGYGLKQLRIVNSVYYTMEKTIELGENSDEITFVMPDDNVTIQPVFTDVSSVFKLDFTDVMNGTIPEGWRCVQENSETHEYPNSYSAGARTFQGFNGYQGKALYWRNDRAEYGRQSAYPLTLEPGSYKLTFAMAAWKESPKYKVQVLDADGKAIATSATLTAAPNANGSSSANVTTAQSQTLDFDIAKEGNYVVSFTDATSGGGYHEFLLLECRINEAVPTGIAATPGTRHPAIGIYSPSGTCLKSLRRGLNIVVGADGHGRKVMVK